MNEYIDDPIIKKLLNEFSISRLELSKYMEEVNDIRSKVNEIFPTNHDFRNKFVLEEKIKAMSSFYTMLLNIRQEYNKIVKEEIEIRRKLSIGSKSEDEDNFDIRKLAELVEEEQKKHKKPESSEDPIEVPEPEIVDESAKTKSG